MSAGHVVCWIKLGEGPRRCVFADPNDNIGYAPLFHSPELDAMAAELKECNSERQDSKKLQTENAQLRHDIVRHMTIADQYMNAAQRAEQAIIMLKSAQCPDPQCSDGWIDSTGPDPQHDPCEWCYGRQMLIDG